MSVDIEHEDYGYFSRLAPMNKRRLRLPMLVIGGKADMERTCQSVSLVTQSGRRSHGSKKEVVLAFMSVVRSGS